MITWIASYPKSGNTWFRILLEALTRQDDTPISINAIDTAGGHGSSRSLFDELAGVKASDLPRDVVERLRPRIYEAAVQSGCGYRYLKVHDAWAVIAPGDPLFPRAITRGVVYLARNPLDVAVSLRFHLSVDQNAAIRFMANTDATIAVGLRNLPKQLPQRLKRWGEHVFSWLVESQLPVHLIRYEDLQSHPVDTLRNAAAFLEIPTDERRIRTAIEAAAFDRLREQEAADGFRERHRGVEVFFRRGESGAWREELDEAQAARIIADHGSMMRHLRYLDAAGRLVC